VLLQATNDSDPWVAFHAARSVWNIEVEDRGIDGLSQEAVSRVAKFLTNPEPGVRIAAAEMIGMAEPAVPALIAALDDPVIEVRCAAADAIAKLGPIAVDAMPKLMTWTSSSLPEERFFGPAAAMAIDPVHHPALAPVLIDVLEQLEGHIRIKAVYALGRRSESGNEAVPLLARLYRGSQNHELRLAIISALAGFGPEVQDALPILIDAVRDPDREVAAAAVRGLGVWGPAAAEAASVLAELLVAELARDEPSDRQDRDLREEFIDLVRSALEGIGVMAGTASKGAKRTDSKRIDA
jgi:HEAT repeat protein